LALKKEDKKIRGKTNFKLKPPEISFKPLKAELFGFILH
jgi:hypothetical protein